jgi:hypothetical protein
VFLCEGDLAGVWRDLRRFWFVEIGEGWAWLLAPEEGVPNIVLTLFEECKGKIFKPEMMGGRRRARRKWPRMHTDAHGFFCLFVFLFFCEIVAECEMRFAGALWPWNLEQVVLSPIVADESVGRV